VRIYKTVGWFHENHPSVLLLMVSELKTGMKVLCFHLVSQKLKPEVVFKIQLTTQHWMKPMICEPATLWNDEDSFSFIVVD
jgi:hypothetical protein